MFEPGSPQVFITHLMKIRLQPRHFCAGLVGPSGLPPLLRQAAISPRRRVSPGHDRTRARQPAATREVADVREDADEDRELQRVRRPASAAAPSRAATAPAARRTPPRPSRRSSGARGPRSSVDGFTRGSRPSSAEQPDRAGHREIGHVVDLPQLPAPVTIATTRPGDVQHRERDDRAPRERVADAAVEGIRLILGEADDVRRGLDAGQLAAQARDAGADQHDAEPQRPCAQSNPCANRSKVSGPGAMKNVQIQIGQWFRR